MALLDRTNSFESVFLFESEELRGHIQVILSTRIAYSITTSDGRDRRTFFHLRTYCVLVWVMASYGCCMFEVASSSRSISDVFVEIKNVRAWGSNVTAIFAIVHTR